MGKPKKVNCQGCWGLKDNDRSHYDHKHFVFERAGTQCPCATCEHQKTCDFKRRHKCKKYWDYEKHCRYHSCDIWDSLGVLHVCAKR